MSAFEREAVGGTPECPIIEPYVVQLHCGEVTLRISPAHDFIMSFPDPKFNYLYYWDGENGLKTVYLTPEAIDYLHTMGISHVARDNITTQEVDRWAEWYSQHLEQEMIDEGF